MEEKRERESASRVIPSVSLYSFVSNLNGATTETGSGPPILLFHRSESVYGPRGRQRGG